MWRADSLENTLMLGKIEGRRRRGWQDETVGWRRWLNRTWVWANSGRWWRTEKPGVLQSMGSQGVGYSWVTEQQSSTTPYNLITSVKILFPNRVIDHSAGTWGFHISFWRTQFNLRHSPGGDSNPSQGYHQVACEMWWRKLQAWKVGSGKVQDYREMGSQRGGNWRTLWAMERPAGITGRVPGRTKDT